MTKKRSYRRLEWITFKERFETTSIKGSVHVAAVGTSAAFTMGKRFNRLLFLPVAVAPLLLFLS